MNPFLEAFVHLCMIVTVAIVVVLGCRIPLRRYAGASLAYASWLLIPIVIVAFVIAKSIPTVPFGLPMLSAIQAPTILASSGQSVTLTGLNAAHVLLAVWLIGMCVMAAWFAIRQYRVVRSLGLLSRDDSTTTTTPMLRAADTSAGPLALGVIRSRIVIPADFYERYSESEQRLVIAHELAHIRGGDLYTNAFATLMQIVFWFNPLVHWAASRMRFDQELACDARVLSASRDFADQARTYAAAVLKTALPKHASPLACHWHSRHPLNERILNMTAPIPPRASRAAAKLALTALVAASCYGALAFADRTPKPSEGQYRIDITYTGVDSRLTPPLNEQRRTFTLIQDAGKEASFKVGSRSVCEFSFAVSPHDNNKVLLQFPHTCDDERIELSKLIVKLGEPAAIERGMDRDGVRISHKLDVVISSGNQKILSSARSGTQVVRTVFRRD
jgi:bla regulator protein blaR1